MNHEATVTVSEMADLLHKSKDSVYRHARQGIIPGFKVGRQWRFLPSEVIAHLKTPGDPWAQSSHSTARRRASLI